MALDLSSLQDVRDFADKFKQSQEKLDILINNAGMLHFL
jgi:short-subunit dehydrogenase